MPSYYIDSNTGERVEIKKTHRVRNFVVLPLAGLFGLVLVGAAIGSGDPSNGPVEPVNSAPSSSTTSPDVNPTGISTVEFTGSGEAMVSIMTGGSSTNTVTLPHTAELPEGFVSVTVSRSPSVESVMSSEKEVGEVGCRIVRDGEVVDEQRASGEFASASCTKYR